MSFLSRYTNEGFRSCDIPRFALDFLRAFGAQFYFTSWRYDGYYWASPGMEVQWNKEFLMPPELNRYNRLSQTRSASAGQSGNIQPQEIDISVKAH
jgi:hypothetical protein